MSGPALRIVDGDPAPRDLADLVRAEFCVDLYLPPRDNAYLYGQHCVVEGCDRPGNDLIVEARRLCQRHAYRFKRATVTIAQFLADPPIVIPRGPMTGLPRYDLTSESPSARTELRFLLQAMHDGHFALTFSTKRWNALRRIYADANVSSLVDVDLVDQPATVVATASAKRFQAFLRETYDQLRGVVVSRHVDVWPRRLYEPFVKSMQGRPPSQMDFTLISAPWLREAAKEIAWHRMGVEGISPTSAWAMVHEVLRLERFAGERLGSPSDITRSLLVDWLAHNRTTEPPRSVSQRLSRLRLFLEHARVGGLAISPDATYLPGELAVREALDRPPKYFDDRELAQLDSPTSQAALDPWNRRAYQVLRHTGMRTRSLVHIPFACLTIKAGAPYLRFFNTKRRGGPTEHTIPISPELAEVIAEQQAWVRSYWPDEQPTWLFPARNANPKGQRPAHGNSVYNALVKWVRNSGLETGDGRELHFWPHRLRHTLGTEMLNAGVPQNVVQDYFGHSSPEMTAHYAKLLDQTLRHEFDAFRKRVNRHGEVIDVMPAGVSADAVALKERIARAKQTLPNGYCGIPIQSRCPHPNACLSCDAFHTGEPFRPVLAEQRARAQEHADAAAAAGMDRLVDVNLADVAALDRILSRLDDLAASAPLDDDFDVREFGAA